MKLKKGKVSFLPICILFVISAYAGRISLGLDFKVGLNLAKFCGEKAFEWEDLGGENKMNIGMIADMGFGLRIGDYFTLQPEVLFSQKGMETIWEGESIMFNLGYLEIPVLLKVNIPAGRVSPSFYLGPALGILLYAKDVYKGKKENIKKDHENIDFGITLGGEISVIAGPGRIIIDTRWTRGLIYMDKGSTLFYRDGMMNRVFSILVGYGINIGGK